jgi:hypothetical protein
MNDVAVIARSDLAIPAMSPAAIDKAREMETVVAAMPQVGIFTDHVIHAGMYSRTIMIPAGVWLTGALVKIPTILTVHGEVEVYIGEDCIVLSGYAVLAASANRKQVFYARTDTWLTMTFKTQSRDVGEIEKEFTDDHELLGSHRDPSMNHTTITEE